MNNIDTSALDCTAFILAGGKSSRMGLDKGLMDFNGKPMINYVIDCVQPLFRKFNIIGNNPTYRQFGIPVIEDQVKNLGPAGGILTGLNATKTEWNFFIACDLPLMDPNLIGLLMREINNGQAIVPVYNRQMEPLCAFYNKNCIQIFQEQIAKSNYKMQDLINKLETKFVDVTEIASLKSDLFENMNSIGDVHKFKVS